MDEHAPDESGSQPPPLRTSVARVPWWRDGMPFVAIVAVAGLVLLLSRPWDKRDGYPPGTAALRETERLGAQDRLAPKAGQPAPDFALQSLDGQVIRLSDLRGHLVLINFWATWCGPCRGEMPELEAVYWAQKDQGLVVLGINVDDASFDDARQLAGDFRDELGLTFPILLDGPSADVFQQYRLRGLPSSFLIDKNGILREIKFGPFNREELREKLEAARRGGT